MLLATKICQPAVIVWQFNFIQFSWWLCPVFSSGINKNSTLQHLSGGWIVQQRISRTMSGRRLFSTLELITLAKQRKEGGRETGRDNCVLQLCNSPVVWAGQLDQGWGLTKLVVLSPTESGQAETVRLLSLVWSVAQMVEGRAGQSAECSVTVTESADGAWNI